MENGGNRDHLLRTEESKDFQECDLCGAPTGRSDASTIYDNVGHVICEDCWEELSATGDAAPYWEDD